MDFIIQNINLEGAENLIIILSLAILVWFLPALLAFFFNKRYFKIILVACIPAALSFFAWLGLLGWSLSSQVKLPRSLQEASKKVVDKLVKKTPN
ncbi:superinfection immunity protein [Pseudoalteromonas nigrifaciens]|uniref:superinfection immunity protein n=1 Tax=Pseudoalteromonas nigrifaciens TaxID=28109 RepID=UPI003D072760